jgi:two-component system, cell cycle response regulator DivK
MVDAMERPTVLVIEDNPLNSELVTDLLETDGLRVRCAESAEVGIKLAREILPQLILMDITLPGMNGVDATKILKADPATRHLTIVGLTAHTASDGESLALDAGFDGYLTKPFEIHTFAATVKEFIAARENKRRI